MVKPPPPGERTRFRSPAHEVVLGLFQATDALRRTLVATLEEAGLTLQQFNVLRILRGAGSEGLPTLEVGGRMLERTPGITRLLDRLEREGLIERSRPSGDRRKVIARITARGRERLAAADGPMAAREEEVMAGFSPAETAALRDLLPRLARAAEAEGRTRPESSPPLVP